MKLFKSAIESVLNCKVKPDKKGENWVKKVTCPLFTIAVFIFLSATIASAQEWKELSSDHFIVYFTGDEKFAKDVSGKAEVYYRRIATELGYPRYSEFWIWDNRVKIYIYPKKSSFLKATNQPKWSEGMADYINKEIVSYAWSEDFIVSLLPHEMAHLIFRDFVGFEGEVPLWLDEGVAQWAEETKRGEMKAKVHQLYETDNLLLLSDMMKLKINTLKDIDRVFIRPTLTKKGDDGILFLSAKHLVTTYYLQAVSLVGFLIERYGSSRFASFCRELRDGKRLEEALRFAYPNSIDTLDKLEHEWRKYLAEGS